MPTPHLAAATGDFAPDVLLPGDPLRARRIAETALLDARLVTQTRGILGYTGWVAGPGGEEGRPLSVLATGMGMPSATIYATELVREYGARRLVRVGTAGGIARQVRIRDVVVATGAHTDSAMSTHRIPGVHFSHVASFGLAARAMAAVGDVGEVGDAGQVGDVGERSGVGQGGNVGASGVGVHAGVVFSSDAFYADRPATDAALLAHGVLAVEMETAGLYAVAAAEGCQALAVLTVTDLVGPRSAPTGAQGDAPRELSADERETGFATALALALAALA